MDDHAGRAGPSDVADEVRQHLFRDLLVDAEPALHRDRHAAARHRLDATGDERRIPHQDRPERTRPHAIGRAAAVEVHLAVPLPRAHPGGLAELRGIGAPELQRDGMLGRSEAQQMPRTAAHERRGGHHLGVEQRARRERPVDLPAFGRRPVHHGCHGHP